MSKTRVNRPNNTTSKLAPRMAHVSAAGLTSGITYNVGRNAEKRRRRALPWSVR